MKKTYPIILTIFLFLLSIPALCQAQQTGKPKMVLEEYLYDANEIEEGKIIEHSFKVLNQGDGMLEIKKVQPG